MSIKATFSLSSFGGFLVRLAILGGFCGDATVAQAPVTSQPVPSQRVFTIPYTPMTRSQLPLAITRLDKKIVCTLLVDTGSNNDFLPDTLVRQLGLTSKPAVKNGHPLLFNGEPSQFVIGTSCEVGTLTITTPLYIVIKQQLLRFTTRQDPTGQSIDGVLSNADLSMFSVLFDTPHHQIKLWFPGNLPDADIRAAGFDPLNSVPLAIPPDDSLCFLTAHFQNGRQEGDEKLLLDTGASETIISSSLAQSLKLKPSPREEEMRMLGGPFQLKRARVSQLTIGKMTVKDVDVVYPSDPKKDHPTVLGMDFLSQHRFLIDFSSRRLFFAE